VLNTERTVPSTDETKILDQQVRVNLDNISYKFDVYDTVLGGKWLNALKDNLQNKRLLEKNFCFLGFADSNRDLSFLCEQLNKEINVINNFRFDPGYERIHPFVPDDFQYSGSLPIGSNQPGLTLKHDACNDLHRHFESLQGTAWRPSPLFLQADGRTKFAIRQLNNICHEIESWVLSHRKKILEPEWMRPAQITTFFKAPRYDLTTEDLELFKQNRYDRELGGVYLHWSQVGKTLFEVFRDEGGIKMDEATCSEINHQRYYSGEFDVEWGKTITEDTFDWKKDEMDDYRKWLEQHNYDWDDHTLALGYAKIGQVRLQESFGTADFQQIHKAFTNNLNIKSIEILPSGITDNYSYRLEDPHWRNLQMQSLGYK